MQLCRHLRWKTFSRANADVEEIRASLRKNQVPFSCLRTCQPWGPDDDLAAPELCGAGRDCFEQDPLADEPIA